eukprot:scaffold25995_cov38-Tisochrysis_lutea.AAC.2
MLAKVALRSHSSGCSSKHHLQKLGRARSMRQLAPLSVKAGASECEGSNTKQPSPENRRPTVLLLMRAVSALLEDERQGVEASDVKHQAL